MAGRELEAMQEGMNRLIRNLRTDPYALETVFISVIAFAGQVKTLTPLTELFAFFPPKLPLGAGTAIGAALEHTAREINTHVTRNTAEAKGDYQPIVYFMSDGSATDRVQAGVEYWQQHLGNRAKLIAVGIGQHADLSAFQSISSEVLRLQGTSDQDFKQFIDWMTQSITAQSRSVGTGASIDKLSLEKADTYDAMKVIYDQLDAVALDNHCVIITGRCSNTKKPYLMKYTQAHLPPEFYHYNPDAPRTLYEFAHACGIDDDYAAWSDNKVGINTVNVNHLIGGGNCPHCYNRYTIAMCGSCHEIMCLAGAGKVQCPSCGEHCEFECGGDDDGFEVSRSKG